jgi:hypothetical protein
MYRHTCSPWVVFFFSLPIDFYTGMLDVLSNFRKYQIRYPINSINKFEFIYVEIHGYWISNSFDFIDD